jgi:hypothetical protein
MHTGFRWESQKERGHKEDIDIGGKIASVWTGLIWLRIGAREGSYEYDKETSGSIECCNILE